MARMTLADRLVSWLDPVSALRRAQARKVLAYYEAAQPSRLRKGRRDTGSGNDAVLRAGTSLRQQARHMEQNYDLALGVLNALVANVVGPNGIGVEPQPRRADGSIDDELAGRILELHKDWAKYPEVTGQHDWAAAQRLLCRAWMRDGEVFAQQLMGAVPFLDHGTQVPLSIEMLECDYVPMDMQSVRPLIQQGIEINAWGRPVAYHVHKAHPLESGSLSGLGQTKRIPARDMLHLANLHRIRQLRGVSIFASVLGRFDDLKDYEESERIAAKVAASMAAFIRKGTPDMYDPEADGTPRGMQMAPGMIFDDLKPGEEIGTIDTNRPNPNLEHYRGGQLKAIAAGTGPTYSTIARTYDGTYSAQRQELVEGWNLYGTLASQFIGRIVRPVYEAFIATAVASGKLKPPAGIVPDSLNDAVYLAPQMPWIDPAKEADAFATLEDRAYISGPEIVRRRGGNPIDVLEQQARWLREKEKRGVPPANAAPPTPPAPDDAPEVKAAKTMAHAQIRAAEIQREAQAAARPAEQHIHLGDTHVAAPVINNNLPEPAVNVTTPAPVVHVAAPVVNLEANLPEQPAPVVNVSNHMAPPAVTVINDVPPTEIRQIEIIAMPTRETSTDVVRDKAGNIVTTTQTESDA